MVRSLDFARDDTLWRLALLAVALLFLAIKPATAQDRYAVLIGGLGGSPEYTDQYRQYLFDTHRVLTETFGFPAANVTVLAEQATSEEPFVADVSNAENIRAHFGTLAGKVTDNDHVYVILFGHGSYDGEHAQLNIPRRDLNDTDYADLVGSLNAGRIVFINTASASAPFVDVLSAPDRIVITATRAGTQRNETTFPTYLVEAFTSPNADLDKDGTLSVRELFQYAAEATARSYEAANHLATEHALLEDTGDAKGYRVEELDEAGEGNLAAITTLRRGGAAIASLSAEERATLGPLLQEKEAIERDIATVKSRKNDLDEDAYYAQLETLFVRLARLNDRIEAGN